LLTQLAAHVLRHLSGRQSNLGSLLLCSGLPEPIRALLSVNSAGSGGHPTTACQGPQIKCPICTGPHCKKHHRALAGCCKGGPADQPPPVSPTPEGAPCPHPARCINCRKPHTADDRQCAFWRHRFDRDWIQARYKEVRERKRSWSPPTNRPASSSGRM
jgi:hypothetical protein